MDLFRSRRGQFAIEFSMMIALAMIALLVLAGVLYFMTYDYSEERNIRRLTDLGYSLQSELILANQVEDGYERIVVLPEKVESAAYTISKVNNDLVITYRGSELLFTVPKNITGAFQKGTNTVRKDLGYVSIN